MKFMWQGKMTPQTAFTYSALPADARPLIKVKSAWLMYLLVIPLLLVAYLAIKIRLLSFDGMLFTKWALFIGVGLSVIFLPVHEMIHALLCPKNSIIYVYFTGIGISLVPTCELRKNRYLLMAMMPTLILGIIPLLVWLIIPNIDVVISSILFGFSVGSLSMCIGDIYNVMNAIIKMPKESKLVTSGTNCYYF